ncbi:MAG: amino acid ABC transporter permease, partial [Rhodospirillaceae bacterium]|nr:amino acid ABC transporter permease [Rhodospirillaceae bacterium]
MSDQTQTYVTGEHPDMEPPILSVGFVGWLRENLFSSPVNTFFTLVGLYIIYITIPPILNWAFISADWTGETKDACTGEGACWPFISAWFKFLMYGRYPVEELWRINTMYVVGGVTLAALIIPGTPRKPMLGLFFLVVFPIISFFMFVGGSFGLPIVETPLWGGLFLTLVIGITGIVVSLPIGIVLALGRRSHMSVVRSVCVVVI